MRSRVKFAVSLLLFLGIVVVVRQPNTASVGLDSFNTVQSNSRSLCNTSLGSLEYAHPTRVWAQERNASSAEANALLQFALEQERNVPGLGRTSRGGSYHGRRDLHKSREPSVVALHEDVRLFARRVAVQGSKSRLSPADVETTVMDSWVNVNRGSASNAWHVHGSSNQLAVVYYASTGNSSGSTILFSEFRWRKLNSAGTTNDGAVAVRVQPGQIVGFPIFLAHSVPETHDFEPRVSFAFNVRVRFLQRTRTLSFLVENLWRRYARAFAWDVEHSPAQPETLQPVIIGRTVVLTLPFENRSVTGHGVQFQNRCGSIANDHMQALLAAVSSCSTRWMGVAGEEDHSGRRCSIIPNNANEAAATALSKAASSACSELQQRLLRKVQERGEHGLAPGVSGGLLGGVAVLDNDLLSDGSSEVTMCRVSRAEVVEASLTVGKRKRSIRWGGEADAQSAGACDSANERKLKAVIAGVGEGSPMCSLSFRDRRSFRDKAAGEASSSAWGSLSKYWAYLSLGQKPQGRTSNSMSFFQTWLPLAYSIGTALLVPLSRPALTLVGATLGGQGLEPDLEAVLVEHGNTESGALCSWVELDVCLTSPGGEEMWGSESPAMVADDGGSPFENQRPSMDRTFQRSDANLSDAVTSLSLPRTYLGPYNLPPSEVLRNGGRRFFLFSPTGGWNNQRMCIEYGMEIARILGRELVIPMAGRHSSGRYKGYAALRGDELFPMDRLLDFERMSKHGAPLVPLSVPIQDVVAMLKDTLGAIVWNATENAPALPNSEVLIIDPKTRQREWGPKEISSILGGTVASSSNVLFLRGDTMFHRWWGFNELSQSRGDVRRPPLSMRRLTTYAPALRRIAFAVVQKLFGPSKSFNAVHVRLGDRSKEMTKRQPSFRTWAKRMVERGFTPGTRLYVATEAENLRRKPEMYAPFTEIWNVSFSSDLPPELLNQFRELFPFQHMSQTGNFGNFAEDMEVILEELICSAADLFWGTSHSRVTQHIVFMRLYHQEMFPEAAAQSLPLTAADARNMGNGRPSFTFSTAGTGKVIDDP